MECFRFAHTVLDAVGQSECQCLPPCTSLLYTTDLNHQGIDTELQSEYELTDQDR